MSSPDIPHSPEFQYGASPLKLLEGLDPTDRRPTYTLAGNWALKLYAHLATNVDERKYVDGPNRTITLPHEERFRIPHFDPYLSFFMYSTLKEYAPRVHRNITQQLEENAAYAGYLPDQLPQVAIQIPGNDNFSSHKLRLGFYMNELGDDKSLAYSFGYTSGVLERGEMKPWRLEWEGGSTGDVACRLPLLPPAAAVFMKSLSQRLHGAPESEQALLEYVKGTLADKEMWCDEITKATRWEDRAMARIQEVYPPVKEQLRTEVFHNFCASAFVNYRLHRYARKAED